MDLATGKNTVYETFSRKDDFNFAQMNYLNLFKSMIPKSCY